MTPRFLDTIYGRLAVPDSDQDLITRFLERYGEWGFCETLILSPALRRRPMSVFDIGAFVGTFGLGVAQVGVRQLLAVEPNVAAFELLKDNITRLGTSPSSAIRAAVGLGGTHSASHVSSESNLGATQWRPVSGPVPADAAPLVTIQELRAQFGDYDLLKLDIEGGETEAIRSDISWIADRRPLIWAECNEDPQSLELVELLFELGLTVRYFAYPSFRVSNFRGATDHIFFIAYEAALAAGAPADVSILGEDWAESETLIARFLSSKEDLREALWQTPRWGRQEWAGRPPHEIAALGREARGEAFEEFLRSP